MSRPTFDFKKMKESIFKKMKRKSRKRIASMPGVYDELPAPRPTDDSTYLRPRPIQDTANGVATEAGEDIIDNGNVPVSGTGTLLPPAPPKPLSDSDVNSDERLPRASFAGVIVKDPARGRKSTNEPGPSKLPRDSRHIVHENEHGEEIEYAISKKDSSPERHKIAPNKASVPSRKNGQNSNNPEFAEDSDMYLEPSQSKALVQKSAGNDAEIARYARHIDVVPNVDPYYTDTSSVGGRASNLINKFEQSTSPKASSPVSYPPVSPLKAATRFDTATENRNEPSNQHGGVNILRTHWDKSGLHSQPGDKYVQSNPLLLQHTVPEKAVKPKKIKYKAPEPPTSQADAKPRSPGTPETKDNVENGKLSPLFDSSKSEEPTKLHETLEQVLSSDATSLQNSPPTSPVYARQYSTESADVQRSPPVLSSNANLRYVYHGKDTMASRHQESPVKKSVSYEEYPRVIASSSRHVTSTQTGNDVFDNDDIASEAVAPSVRGGHIQMKSRGTSVETTTVISPVTHIQMKTRGTSVGFEPDLNEFVPTRQDRSRQVKYEDDADFDDGVSRVHYVPKHENRRQRVRIETYREEFTQTDEAEFSYTQPRRKFTSRSKTYNHTVKERSRLPQLWQNHELENYRSDNGTDSKRVSKEWYKKEDAPNLWDPDHMLNMFAEELDRKAKIGNPQGGVELREEFDPKKFLEYVPKQDSSGAPFPPWKRLVMAKQMAEKAQLEHDQRNMKSEGEVRLENMPLWKRVIVQRNAERAGHS